MEVLIYKYQMLSLSNICAFLKYTQKHDNHKILIEKGITSQCVTKVKNMPQINTKKCYITFNRNDLIF